MPSDVGQVALAALRAAGFTTLDQLSQATVSQLTQVPRIGAATARAILDTVQGQYESNIDPVQTYWRKTYPDIP